MVAFVNHIFMENMAKRQVICDKDITSKFWLRASTDIDQIKLPVQHLQDSNCHVDPKDAQSEVNLG